MSLSSKDLYLWFMIMMSSTVSCVRLSGVIILREFTCVDMLMCVFSGALSSFIFFYSESMSYMDIMTLQGEAHMFSGDLLVVGRFQGDEASAVEATIDQTVMPTQMKGRRNLPPNPPSRRNHCSSRPPHCSKGSSRPCNIYHSRLPGDLHALTRHQSH